MTIKDWWPEALGIFKATGYIDLSQFKGMRFAVDFSIFINKFLCSDIDKLATTSEPAYPAPDLLQNIMKLHENLSRYITLVYIYDGIAPPHKQGTKDNRLQLRNENGAKWFEQLDRAKENETISDEQLKEATASRMSMSHPTAIDHAAILKWMKEGNIEHYGSLYEADQQLVQLERDGIVDGIISEDGDEVALGARRLLCKMSRKSNGDYQFKLFEREMLLRADNPYQSKLCKYPDLITHAALLLGNDYNPRVGGNGAKTVLHGCLPPSRKRKSTDDNRTPLPSMLDELSDASDKKEWINNYGRNGKKPLSQSESETYWKAWKYMQYAPVLQYDIDTKEVKIVTLNPLPDDVDDLGEYLGLDDLAALQNDKSLLYDIYHCNVIPVNRKPQSFYKERLASPIFGELDFSVPISIQPTLCLVNYLRARSIDARLGDARDKIEATVVNCLRVEKQLSATPLKPIAGIYNGFKSIAPRPSDNGELDQWCEDCSPTLSMVEFITDDVIDGLLGKLRSNRPSIRRRVKNLVAGGHYDLTSLKRRDVVTRNDGKECVLICCSCLSSKSGTMHTVYAVFEDTPDGKYLIDASSCSCKKGEHFCSHSIGFLYMVRVIQDNTLDTVKENYRPNPKLVQDNLMLIENAVVGDKFKQQNAQRKRRRYN